MCLIVVADGHVVFLIVVVASCLYAYVPRMTQVLNFVLSLRCSLVFFVPFVMWSYKYICQTKIWSLFLFFLVCVFFFFSFVARACVVRVCPSSRRRRNDLRPSLIDVDDTYIIDGEGQPAILALDSHVRMHDCSIYPCVCVFYRRGCVVSVTRCVLQYTALSNREVITVGWSQRKRTCTHPPGPYQQPSGASGGGGGGGKERT